MTGKLIIKTNNPFDYNSVVAKQMERKLDLPSPENAKLNLNAKMIGKFLGVDTVREWSQMYDKVWSLYNWARENTKSDDVNKLISFLNKKSNSAPSFNGRRIDDLHIAYKLDKTSEKPVRKILGEYNAEPEKKKEVHVEAKAAKVEKIEKVEPEVEPEVELIPELRTTSIFNSVRAMFAEANRGIGY